MAPMETTTVTRLPRTIVIVGAGFSGTAVAINLLRLSYWKPVRIVLVERAARMARGAAYAERPYPYLLNVPAGRMSLASSDPLEFLKFAQRHFPNATADDFLPRSVYGEYLEAALRNTELASPSHVHLHRIQGDVCSLERATGSSQFRVKLDDGSTLPADDVVLALGNPPPEAFPGSESLRHSSRYVGDPWSSQTHFQPGETALVIGTGLTMADKVLSGSAATRDRVTFHAISRRGLVPPSQTAFRHAGCDEQGVTLLRAASASARQLVRAVRQLSDEVQHRGGDWREAITCVRNLAPALWQRLSTQERRRFLRHARPYWDVHRHRLPQETLAKLQALQRSNKLHVHAGRIVKFELAGEKIQVSWHARGSDTIQTLLVDRVINCTGADYNPRRSRDRLTRSLLDQGLLTPDTLGLGIRTAAHGAPIDSRNRVVENLYYIGPMLRADHWESTAAQELRVHAERLAHHLSTSAVTPMFASRQAPQQSTTAIVAAPSSPAALATTRLARSV